MSSSLLARTRIATGSWGSGICHGSSTSGVSTGARVSLVSARLSRPMAQRSPATTAWAGRWVLPSGTERVPIRSTSSWSWWLDAGSPPFAHAERCPDTCTVASGCTVPENTRTRLTRPT